MEDRTFLVADVASMAGLKPRTVQFWTLNGVIECDPATRHGGSGVKRRYELPEVVIAAFLGVIARLSVPVGQLKQAAQKIREVLLLHPQMDKESRRRIVDDMQSRHSDALDTFYSRMENEVLSRELSDEEFRAEEKRIRGEEREKHGIAAGEMDAVYMWDTLWTAIEGGKEAMLILSNSDDESWSVLGVNDYFMTDKEIHLSEVPDAWGAVFLIRSSEALRNMP